MSVLSIRKEGDPILRGIAYKVESKLYGEYLEQLSGDMAETMWANNGIGLAAPQVGVALRVIVLAQGGRKVPPMVMVNPDIRSASDFQQSIEGCLSVAKSKWNQAVSRRKRIVVYYQETDGTPKRLKCAGQFAAVIQHEIDHLNGILFTDYVRPLARQTVSADSQLVKP